MLYIIGGSVNQSFLRIELLAFGCPLACQKIWRHSVSFLAKNSNFQGENLQELFVNVFYSLLVWIDTSLQSHLCPATHNSTNTHQIDNHCLLSSAILNTFPYSTSASVRIKGQRAGLPVIFWTFKNKLLFFCIYSSYAK